MKLCSLVLVTAFIVDALLGDPPYRLHPVRLMGHTIKKIESLLRKRGMQNALGGVVLTISVIIICPACYLALRIPTAWLSQEAALVLDLFVVYSCIASKDLLMHMMPIVTSLKGGNIQQARQNLAMVVGRSTQTLNSHGIARAAVESVAESFTDAILAPILSFLTGCVLGALIGINPLPIAVCAVLVYRATNTLDSMVGYKNKEYQAFGTASARLDDVFNWIPARLTVIPLYLASLICGLKSREALRSFFRDRLKHSSPNSAHPESFVAGALSLRLGGPTTYPHGLVEKQWIGDGTELATPLHITCTCRLIQHASWISLFLSAILIFLLAG